MTKLNHAILQAMRGELTDARDIFNTVINPLFCDLRLYLIISCSFTSAKVNSRAYYIFLYTHPISYVLF